MQKYYDGKILNIIVGNTLLLSYFFLGEANFITLRTILSYFSMLKSILINLIFKCHLPKTPPKSSLDFKIKRGNVRLKQ